MNIGRKKRFIKDDSFLITFQFFLINNKWLLQAHDDEFHYSINYLHYILLINDLERVFNHLLDTTYKNINSHGCFIYDVKKEKIKYLFFSPFDVYLKNLIFKAHVKRSFLTKNESSDKTNHIYVENEYYKHQFDYEKIAEKHQSDITQIHNELNERIIPNNLDNVYLYIQKIKKGLNTNHTNEIIIDFIEKNPIMKSFERKIKLKKIL